MTKDDDDDASAQYSEVTLVLTLFLAVSLAAFVPPGSQSVEGLSQQALDELGTDTVD